VAERPRAVAEILREARRSPEAPLSLQGADRPGAA
jgi:hypothetical protein